MDEVVSLEKSHKDFSNIIHAADRDGSSKSIRDQVFALQSSKQNQMDRTNDLVKQKNTEIQRLEGKTVNYPHYVSNAIEAIKRECPQANPVVL